MRFQILGVAALACISFVAACGSNANPTSTPPPSSSAGSGNSPGAAGATTGAAGSGNSAGAVGSAGSGGSTAAGAGGADTAAGAAGVTGSAGSAGAGTAGSTGMYGGVPGVEDLSTVKASAGCGLDPAVAFAGITPGKWAPGDQSSPGYQQYMVGYQIPIMTPADHPVTAIAGKVLQRRYFIKLPTGYDKTKPYKMIYEGAGCTGKGIDVSDFSTVANGAAIIVGLQIYPGVWGGGSGPDGGANGAGGVSCFDDKRGALSIEKPFIEALHAKLTSSLCIDEHRVFISGHSSGAWLSNQFGNAYGSNIIRAIAPSSGGLAQGTQQQPTDGLPVPGIWWHQLNDGTNPYQGTIDAITHALVVNKCTVTDFKTSPKAAATYPNVSICQKFTSCPAEFPITLCTEDGSNHENAFDKPDQMKATWAFFDAF